LKTLFDYAWVTQKGTASYDFYYLGKPTNERRRFQALDLTNNNLLQKKWITLNQLESINLINQLI
jgi:hypothetical protein